MAWKLFPVKASHRPWISVPLLTLQIPQLHEG
jgi:hypothetical protein